MSLEQTTHTRAQALEALRRIAARRGRAVDLEPRADRARDRRRVERNVELCDALIDLLAASFGASGAELRSPLRCRRDVARVRQIGMYVAHTGFGMAMSDVAAGFARDRTTVMYACHLIEDMRDDAEFDAIVSAFERTVNSAFTARRMAA